LIQAKEDNDSDLKIEVHKEAERKQELAELTNQLSSKSASDQLSHMKNKLETLKKQLSAIEKQ